MIRADSQEMICKGYDWSMDYSRGSTASFDSGIHYTSCRCHYFNTCLILRLQTVISFGTVGLPSADVVAQEED